MLESDQAYIPIRDVMRVELSAGAFQVTNLSSLIQNIETNEIGEPTLWVWRIEPLPEKVNEQFLVIIVYRGEENIPVWQRAYQVRIAGPTPTTSAPTPAPTILERLTDQLIDNSPIILTAILGFIVSGIGFLYRTYKKRQEKIEALQEQSQTAQDKQEIEERIATLQSIKWWQFWK
jgi:hypothetical protein